MAAVVPLDFESDNEIKSFRPEQVQEEIRDEEKTLRLQITLDHKESSGSPSSHNGRILGKLLHDNSGDRGNNSWREYYRDSAAVGVGVPFQWECRPGTPKHSRSVNFQDQEYDHGGIMLPLSPPPRLKTKFSSSCHRKSSSSSTHKTLFHKMRRLLRSPSRAWVSS